jgi:subtilase family serine protease
MSGTRVKVACGLAGALLAAICALVTAAGAQAALARVGTRAAIPNGAVVHGPLAFATRLHVDVTLKPRNPAALAAYATAVSTLGSADYRRYLTPAQFARRFGATPAQVERVLAALRARGLHPGAVSAGALSIPVVATAAQLEHAFSISLSQVSLPGRRTGIVADERPAFARAAASDVQAVVGLNTTSAPHPLLVRPPASASRAVSGSLTALTGASAAAQSARLRAHAASAGPQACAAATAAQGSGAGAGAFTDNQIASAYGFTGLYGSGDEGAGMTVAVYELEPDDPADIAAYESCYGIHASISYVPVDDGAGTGSGSGEAALDIENLIGLAPDVKVLVYQGPNSDSGAPGSGPYDVFNAIVNQDRARVVTVSWGQCEPAVGQADAIAENSLFEQAAVQGQSIVAADGDSGAQDCDVGGTIPQTQVAVDDPSSQPYVTGVGGTSLTALGPRPSEAVWNSGGNVLTADIQPGASGGGVSSLWGMPAAQLDAAASLGVRTTVPGGSACGRQFCREVPDVSADADPSTGYLFYWNGNGSQPGQPAGWQGIGGTSAAAPLWAALLALADASPSCGGESVGYADPALYRSAGAAYGADFNDITTGNNDFTGTNEGQYAATPGYDPVTGLGTPYAVSLVPGLCANSVQLVAPASERSTVHAAVSVRLKASDVPGTPVTYAATGLPPGLKLNSATGQITGRPSRTGSFQVKANAHDSEGSTSPATFTWTVGAVPKLTRLSLAPDGHGGAQLSFTLTAGTNAPDLETIAVTVPRGLRLGSARSGVRITNTARHPSALRFTSRVTRGSTITIKLRSGIASMHVVLAPPALRLSGGRVADSVKRSNRPKLTVSVTDASAGRSRLTGRLALARR